MTHLIEFRKASTRVSVQPEYRLLVFTFEGKYHYALRIFPKQDFSDTLGRRGVQKVFQIGRPLIEAKAVELLFQEAEKIARERGISHLIRFDRVA